METDHTVTQPLNLADDDDDVFIKRFPSIAAFEQDPDRDNDTCACRLPILHPHGPIRLCWDVVVMFVLVYTCIEVPFSLAFDISLTLDMRLGVFALCIDCLLLFDVCLNFRTAYYDKYNPLQLVTSPRAICCGYIQSWFLLDLFTSIPFEFLLPANEMTATRLIKMLRVFRLLRLVKLLRFFRMIKTFNNFLRGILTRSVVIMITVFKILFLMMLSAHYIACVWWFVGVSSLQSYEQSWVLHGDVDYLHDENMGIALQYIKSFYFSVVTLFTTGYGDITPKNAIEELVCCGIILSGTCFFAYFIGAVSNLIAEGDSIRAARIAKVEEGQAFCISKRLPSPLSIRVLEHLKYYWSQNFIYDEFEVMNALPPAVQREITRFCSQRYFVDQLPLFQDLPEHVRGLLAFKLKATSCADNEYLFHERQFGKAMYIQVTGVSLLHRQCDRGYSVIKRGHCFGYFNLIGVRRNCSLKTLTYSEFYCLGYEDIRQVLQTAFPRVWHKFWRKIKQRVSQLVKQNQHIIKLRASPTSASSSTSASGAEDAAAATARDPDGDDEDLHLLTHSENAHDDAATTHCCVHCKRKMASACDSIRRRNDVRYRDRKISNTAEKLRGKMDREKESHKMATQMQKRQRCVQQKVVGNPSHCYNETFVDDLEHSPIEDSDDGDSNNNGAAAGMTNAAGNTKGSGGGRQGKRIGCKGRSRGNKENVSTRKPRGNGANNSGSVTRSRRAQATAETTEMVMVQIDKHEKDRDEDNAVDASLEENKNGELDKEATPQSQTELVHEEESKRRIDGVDQLTVEEHQTSQNENKEIEDVHANLMLESRDTEDVKMELDGSVQRLQVPKKRRKKKKRKSKVKKTPLNSQDEDIDDDEGEEESVSGSFGSLNSLSQSIIDRVLSDEEDDDDVQLQEKLNNLAPMLSNTNKDTDASVDTNDMAPTVGLRKYSLIESQTVSHHDE